MPVPGAFELPLAAMALSKSRSLQLRRRARLRDQGRDASLRLRRRRGGQRVLLAGLETGVPVAFGVLSRHDRAGPCTAGKGAEAVKSALEMADAFARLRVVAAANARSA